MEVETKPSKQGDLVDFNLDCLPFHQGLEEVREESKVWHMPSCSGRRCPKSSSSIISTSFALVYGTQLHKAEFCQWNPKSANPTVIQTKSLCCGFRLQLCWQRWVSGARVGCGAAPGPSAGPSACQVCPALGQSRRCCSSTWGHSRRASPELLVPDTAAPALFP